MLTEAFATRWHVATEPIMAWNQWCKPHPPMYLYDWLVLNHASTTDVHATPTITSSELQSPMIRWLCDLLQLLRKRSVIVYTYMYTVLWWSLCLVYIVDCSWWTGESTAASIESTYHLTTDSSRTDWSTEYLPDPATVGFQSCHLVRSPALLLLHFLISFPHSSITVRCFFLCWSHCCSSAAFLFQQCTG